MLLKIRRELEGVTYLKAASDASEQTTGSLIRLGHMDSTPVSTVQHVTILILW